MKEEYEAQERERLAALEESGLVANAITIKFC